MDLGCFWPGFGVHRRLLSPPCKAPRMDQLQQPLLEQSGVSWMTLGPLCGSVSGRVRRAVPLVRPLGQALLPPRGHGRPSHSHFSHFRDRTVTRGRAGLRRWAQSLPKGLIFGTGCGDIVVPWSLGMLCHPPCPPALILQRAGGVGWGRGRSQSHG